MPLPKKRPPDYFPGTACGGAALLVMLFLIVTTFSTAIVFALSKANLATQRQQKTVEALAQAKEALLAYASTHERPGVLPCPDTNNDGTGDPNGDVACYSRIGRLPWKQLKLTDLRDGTGERLWYVVSAEFANVPSAQVVNNEESLGALNICGANGCGDSSPIPTPPSVAPYPATNVGAIVFAPGIPLAGNDRLDGVDTDPDPAINGDPAKKPSNFLDTVEIGAKTFSNSSGSTNGNDFIAADPAETFNDQMLTISASEIFHNVNKRLETKASLYEIAACLAAYGLSNSTSADHRLPWSTPLLIDVGNVNNFVDSIGQNSGRLPYRIASSASQLPAHDWSTTSIPAAKRNTLGACSNFPKWWTSWKSYVFYAVASNFTPDFGGGLAPSPNSCSVPAGCLSVNGGVGKFAAVVIFSGKRIAAQTRTSLGEKQDKNNYLEDENLSSIGSSGTDFKNSIPSAAFNDTIVCINPDMSISLDCS